MNYLIIIGVILVIALLGLLFGPKLLARSEDKTKYITTYNELKSKVRNEISDTISFSSIGLGLSEEEIAKQVRTRDQYRTYIGTASSGDFGARRAVQQLVKDKLYSLLQSEEDVDRLMYFSPENATPVVQFEAALYCFGKQNPDGEICGNEFKKFMDSLKALKAPGSDLRVIGPEEVNLVYRNIYEEFYYEDKISVLSQLIFSELYGLGVIDTINYQNVGIEEIQVGLNGEFESMYDYKRKADAGKEALHAKDSTYVIYGGKVYWLKFLGSQTNKEMVRLIKNLILNAGAGDLTEQNPYILTDTVDGRRIEVSRPPFTDSWTAFIRKFNSVSVIHLSDLYKDELIVNSIRMVIKSGMNIAFTGEMESGKTTLLRAGLTELDPKFCIRIIERESFELNGRKYLNEINAMSMKIYDVVDEDDTLSYSRKTSGTHFVIGEITSQAMANLYNKVAKIATQLLCSAHYPTTEKMIADFKNAKLKDGFSIEALAEDEVVSGLGYDVHVRNKDGVRFIEYINEVVPIQAGEYKISPMIVYDENIKKYVPKHKPSDRTYEKARKMLNDEEYNQFIEFFDTMYSGCVGPLEDDDVKVIIEETSPKWVEEAELADGTYNY